MKDINLETKLLFLSQFIHKSYPFLKNIRVSDNRWDHILYLSAEIDYVALSRISNIALRKYYTNEIKHSDYNYSFTDHRWGEFLYLLFNVENDSKEKKYFLSLQKEIVDLINMLNKQYIIEEYKIYRFIQFDKFFVYKS